MGKVSEHRPAASEHELAASERKSTGVTGLHRRRVLVASSFQSLPRLRPPKLPTYVSRGVGVCLRERLWWLVPPAFTHQQAPRPDSDSVNSDFWREHRSGQSLQGESGQRHKGFPQWCDRKER